MSLFGRERKAPVNASSSNNTPPPLQIRVAELIDGNNKTYLSFELYVNGEYNYGGHQYVKEGSLMPFYGGQVINVVTSNLHALEFD
jgi:hypothetical protein